MYEGFRLKGEGYEGFRYRGCPECVDRPVYEGFRFSRKKVNA